jgi:hypothetical protein
VTVGAVTLKFVAKFFNAQRINFWSGSLSLTNKRSCETICFCWSEVNSFLQGMLATMLLQAFLQSEDFMLVSADAQNRQKYVVRNSVLNI